MLGILIIIALIIVSYNDIKKRNQRKIVRYDTQTGTPIYEGDELLGYNTQTGAPIYGRKNTKKERTKEDKARLANSIMMIAGAGLVVFASLVFMASSWDSIPNIVKPLILVGLQVLFYVFYMVCNNNLDIPKTGKMFKVLSFLFMPIVLSSLSFFELVGDSLSIGGELEWLYFTIVFIICDIVYKLYDWKFKDLAIKRASYFMELLAIISFGDLFEEGAYCLVILAAYNVIMSILCDFNYVDSVAYKKINEITSYFVIVFLGFAIEMEEETIYHLGTAFFAIYYFIKYLKNIEPEYEQKNFVIFIINYVLTLLIVNELEISPLFIYSLALIPITILAKRIKNEGTKNFLKYALLIVQIILIIQTALSYESDTYYLLSYICGFASFLIMYKLLEMPAYKYGAYVSTMGILYSILDLASIDDFDKYIPLVIVVLTSLMEIIFEKLHDKYSHIFAVVLLSFSSIALCNEYTVLIPLALTIIYSKYYKINSFYVLVPAIIAINVCSQDEGAFTIVLGLILMIIYSTLSIMEEKFNGYTLSSLIAIIVGCAMLDFEPYVICALVAIWGAAHTYFKIEDKNCNVYKIICLLGGLGTYCSILNEIGVEFSSLYYLGYYVALMILTYVILEDTKDYKALGTVLLVLISLSSFFAIDGLADGIILIAILFVFYLFAFKKRYNSFMYTTLIFLILRILASTIEFWESIPWYFYILLLGLALIVFAMFDEKLFRKNKKEIPETPSNEQNTVEENKK